MQQCLTRDHEKGAVKDPLIFDIAQGSFVDGPGVRTIVFFKGCPLSCPWCHNPEAINYQQETMFFAQKCIQCGNCQKGMDCFTNARKQVGKHYGQKELVNILLEDAGYYTASGGGVTFSGGEAFGFPYYLGQVAGLLKKEGIHICVQTSGYFDYEKVCEQVLPHIDEIYFDFKIMNENSHKKVLGKSNRLILENFVRLSEEQVKLVPRIALIPGHVATAENLDALALFFVEHQVKTCQFLYYNPCGDAKLVRLGRKTDQAEQHKIFTPEENQEWINYFKDQFTRLQNNRQLVLSNEP